MRIGGAGKQGFFEAAILNFLSRLMMFSILSSNENFAIFEGLTVLFQRRTKTSQRVYKFLPSEKLVHLSHHRGGGQLPKNTYEML